MQYKPTTLPRRADEDEDEDEELRPNGAFRIKSTPANTKHTVWINRAFTSVEQFEPLVALLENAVEGDIVEIKLSTPGGAIHAVIPLMCAIAGTQASVFVHAISDVASAGTFLLMLADDVYVNPYSTVMFHQVTFGAYGQGNQVEDRVVYVQQSAKQLLNDMYQDFFSADEMAQMLSGKEFWMSKTDFDTRYTRRRDITVAKMEATLKESVAPAKTRKRRVKVTPEE